MSRLKIEFFNFNVDKQFILVTTVYDRSDKVLDSPQSLRNGDDDYNIISHCYWLHSFNPISFIMKFQKIKTFLLIFTMIMVDLEGADRKCPPPVARWRYADRVNCHIKISFLRICVAFDVMLQTPWHKMIIDHRTY